MPRTRAGRNWGALGLVVFAVVARLQGNAFSAEFVPLPGFAAEVASQPAGQAEICKFPPISKEGDGSVLRLDADVLSGPDCGGTTWEVEACVRGCYLNDQRIEWSGVEATFAAEAVVAPRLEHSCENWDAAVQGEFYLNQPFDRNILVDTAERASYRANFDIPVFEISQLYLSVERDACAFLLGKFPTPFGRTYFPLYTNSRLDAPFIRTECILWRETGALFRFEQKPLGIDVAVTNGCEDQDPNSSKGLVARVGADADCWACGFSVKVQDGVGSENQKVYKNHVGVDSMVRFGCLTLSTEAIYDEYGFRRPGFDPLDVTWGRSIYYRDLNYRLDAPLTGLGYYVDATFDLAPFIIACNYGEYYPQELGIPQHDVVQRRGILKGAYAVTNHVQFFAATMLETDGYIAQEGRPRKGWVVLAGMQWAL